MDLALAAPRPSLLSAVQAAAGYVALGLVTGLRTGGPEWGLPLVTLPILGGVVVSALSLVVLAESTGHPGVADGAARIVAESLRLTGRLALALCPVLGFFATTDDASLYRALAEATVVVLGAYAVLGIGVRGATSLGRGTVAGWGVFCLLVVVTLLQRVA